MPPGQYMREGIKSLPSGVSLPGGNQEGNQIVAGWQP